MCLKKVLRFAINNSQPWENQENFRYTLPICIYIPSNGTHRLLLNSNDCTMDTSINLRMYGYLARNRYKTVIHIWGGKFCSYLLKCEIFNVNRNHGTVDSCWFLCLLFIDTNWSIVEEALGNVYNRCDSGKITRSKFTNKCIAFCCLDVAVTDGVIIDCELCTIFISFWSFY